MLRQDQGIILGPRSFFLGLRLVSLPIAWLGLKDKCYKNSLTTAYLEQGAKGIRAQNVSYLLYV